MPAAIRRQLRMEGEPQAVALLDGDRLVPMAGEFLDVRRSVGELWGADEDRGGGSADGRGGHLRFEAVDLPAVGVATDADVHQLQRFLVRPAVLDLACHQDHPGAGTHHRHAGRGALLDQLLQRGIHQMRHRRALTPRQDQGVDRLQVTGETDRNALHFAGAQRRQVFAKIALQRQDADPAAWVAHQPLPASSSSWGIAPISNPRIALPRLLEASARMSGRSKYVVAATIALARAEGFSALKMPEPTKMPSQPSCIISAASAGVAMPPAAKLTTGRRPRRAVSSSRSEGAPIRLASMTSSSGPAPCSLRMALVTARMCRTASTTLPVPASPLVRIIAAPSPMRRRASPRLRAPQTKGTLKLCLRM